MQSSAGSSARRPWQRRAGKKKLFGKREVLPGVGVYLDGGFGVGKTHLLASSFYTLAAPTRAGGVRDVRRADPAGGVFGFVECIDLLADYVVVCIDEFELDDPGNTTLVRGCCRSWSNAGYRSRRRRTPCPSSSAKAGSPRRTSCARSTRSHRFSPTVRIEGPDYRHRGSATGARAADRPAGDRAGRTVAGGDTRRFRRAVRASGTMHPSRYQALIESVTEVFVTGVHALDDQSVALRLVSLTDRLYDAGIPVVASGDKAGHHLLRGDAGRRIPQEVSARHLAAAGTDRGGDGRALVERADHHIVVLGAGAQSEGLGAADGEAVLAVKPLRAFVFLIDAEPHAGGAEVDRVVKARPASGPTTPRRRGCRAARRSWTVRPRAAR